MIEEVERRPQPARPTHLRGKHRGGVPPDQGMRRLGSRLTVGRWVCLGIAATSPRVSASRCARSCPIGDDYWIENDQGERAYKVNGKALRIRETFVIEGASGQELIRIQERKLSIRDKVAIERGGDKVATVHKALVGIRDRFAIDVENGADMKAKGNSSTTSTRSSATATRSRRSPRSGSACGTPTASPSRRTRTPR